MADAFLKAEVRSMKAEERGQIPTNPHLSNQHSKISTSSRPPETVPPEAGAVTDTQRLTIFHGFTPYKAR